MAEYHVGCGLFGTIYAGTMMKQRKDGLQLWRSKSDVTDEAVKAIAQKKPFYAVFRDSGMADDSVLTNFEQIFEAYSPQTVRKVI